MPPRKTAPQGSAFPFIGPVPFIGPADSFRRKRLAHTSRMPG